MSTRRFLLVVVLASAVAALLALGRPARVGAETKPVPVAPRPVAAPVAPDTAKSLSNAFRAVAASVKPSVVGIAVVKEGGLPDASGVPDDLFRFFGFPRPDAPRSPGSPRMPEPRERAGGTGVIVSADGHVLTNNHVVEGAASVKVRLADNGTYDAEIVGTDPKSDLAVLKIDAKGLTPATWGDSDALDVGDWVIAVGNPLGLDQSVTAGIVSAKGRTNLNVTDYEDFIQTDAAINPGNSGGPLVTLDGSVVGINSAIASRTGFNMGIGFAIPASQARKVMESLVRFGKVERGWLGVSIQPVTPELAKSFGYSGTDGALIGDVTDGSPADDAGLEQGDIIVSLDGTKIDTVPQLRRLVADLAAGHGAKIGIVRDGVKKSITVKIGRMPGEPDAPLPESPSDEIGMMVESVTADWARRVGVEEGEGVVVTRVVPGSAAEDAGIGPGDVIVSVAGTPVHDPRSFRQALRDRRADGGARLQIVTQGSRRFAYLDLGGD